MTDDTYKTYYKRSKTGGTGARASWRKYLARLSPFVRRSSQKACEDKLDRLVKAVASSSFPEDIDRYVEVIEQRKHLSESMPIVGENCERLREALNGPAKTSGGRRARRSTGRGSRRLSPSFFG